MKLTNPFAVDLRALAVLRIALGAILLVDLALRTSQLHAHLSDAAAYPLERAHGMLIVPISVHLISGNPWFQGGLMALAMLAAALLVIGYRTRLMTAVSWYLLISLHHRSYHIQDVGDQLLRLLLLWCIFLPLGRRYSMDTRKSGELGASTVSSPASAGLLLQVAMLLFMSVFHKLKGSTWRNGEALGMVLDDDTWVRPLGHLVAQVPWLPPALTYATLVIEFVAPLLLLSPIATVACRRVAIFFLAAFTIGIGTNLELGVIPWVVSACLIPFMPAGVWDWLDRRLGQRAGEARHTTAARGPGRPARVAMTLISSVLLIQLFTANIDALAEPQRTPAVVRRVEFCLGLDQAWGMYSPDPIAISFRLHLRLDLEDGEQVNLVIGRERAGWPAGEGLQALDDFWDSYRGRMLLDYIVYPELALDLRPFLVWACDQWTAEHPERPVRSAGLSKEIRAVRPATWRPGQLHPQLSMSPLVGHLCSDHRPRVQ